VSELYIARSAAIAARVLDGEAVIMSAVDSTLYTLNATATALWQAADGVTPLRRIVEEQLCRQFAVSLEEGLRDAEEFVRTLAPHGILLVAEHPLEAAAGEGR